MHDCAARFSLGLEACVEGVHLVRGGVFCGGDCADEGGTVDLGECAVAAFAVFDGELVERAAQERVFERRFDLAVIGA